MLYVLFNTELVNKPSHSANAHVGLRRVKNYESVEKQNTSENRFNICHMHYRLFLVTFCTTYSTFLTQHLMQFFSFVIRSYTLPILLCAEFSTMARQKVMMHFYMKAIVCGQHIYQSICVFQFVRWYCRLNTNVCEWDGKYDAEGRLTIFQMTAILLGSWNWFYDWIVSHSARFIL